MAPSLKNGYQWLKNKDRHMLNPAELTKVAVGRLMFEISFPNRGEHQSRYDSNWDIYRTRHWDDVPEIGSLAIQDAFGITRF